MSLTGLSKLSENKVYSTYMGVELKGGLTSEAVIYIVNNYKRKSTVEITKKFNLDNRQVVSGALRVLYNTNVIKKVTKTYVPKKERKEDKKVVISNTFDNYDGDNKAIARDMIVNAITSMSSLKSNILTLPADRWIMEKKILDKKPLCKFTAVERDADTFAKMQLKACTDEQLKGSVLQTTWGDLGTVIDASKTDQYSHAILDYCGFIDTFYDEIKKLMDENMVRVGGVISMTFSTKNRHLHRDGKISGTVLQVMENNMRDKGVTDSAFTTDFLVKSLVFSYGGRYKIDNFLSYKDNPKGHDMFLYIVKRME